MDPTHKHNGSRFLGFLLQGVLLHTFALESLVVARQFQGSAAGRSFLSGGIFRDPHTTPPRIPKDMGRVWETYHKGVPLLGVPENTLDIIMVVGYTY